jgi:hypothetical protein
MAGFKVITEATAGVGVSMAMETMPFANGVEIETVVKSKYSYAKELR